MSVPLFRTMFAVIAAGVVTFTPVRALAEEPPSPPPRSFAAPFWVSPPAPAAGLVSPTSAGADFVPFALQALIPVAPGTEVTIQAVESHRPMARPLACAGTSTEPVAFAVSEWSTLVSTLPPNCSDDGLTIQVLAVDQVVASFTLGIARKADIAALAFNRRDAARTYGWHNELRTSHPPRRDEFSVETFAAVLPIMALITTLLLLHSAHRSVPPERETPWGKSEPMPRDRPI